MMTVPLPSSAGWGPRTAKGSRLYPPLSAASAASTGDWWLTAMQVILSGEQNQSRSLPDPPYLPDISYWPWGPTPTACGGSLTLAAVLATLLLNGGLLDVIQLGELAVQVRVAFRLNAGLVRLLAVLA